MSNSIIKINWLHDVCLDKNYIWNFRNTNLPLNGIYEDEDGSIRYLKNGILHNENGPAFISKDGYETYWINKKRHRIDGPAEIYPVDDDEWYINDYHVDSEAIETWLTENDIPLDWNTWTDSDKMLFALHWSDYNG